MKVFSILLLALCLFSCTEEIDIRLRTTETRLVIEGGISLDTTAHTIILSKTMDFFDRHSPIPFISGAIVTITEFGEDTLPTGRVFHLTEGAKKGHYETEPDVYGRQRHIYRLEISNVDVGRGLETYRADAFFPPIADRIDSIRAVFGQNILFLLLSGREPDTNSIRTGWNIEVFAQDPPGENFYLMVICKNGVALNDTLTRLFLFDNQMIHQRNIALNGLPMAFISDSSWMAAQEGDTIGLEIRGVSESYYRYIHEFGRVYGGTNPMFGGAPANVRGNVRNMTGRHDAIGYFWAHGSRRAYDIADISKKPTFSDWSWLFSR